MSEPRSLFKPRLNRRRRVGRVFAVSCAMVSLVGLAFLAVLIIRVLWEGASWFGWEFLV